MQALLDPVAGAGPVGLKERLRVGGGDLLNRLGCKRAEPNRGPARSRGARDRKLAVGVHRLHPGWAEQHRQLELDTHDRDRLVALLGRLRDVGREPELPECGQVVLERHPALGAGDDRLVDRAWECPPGAALGFGDGLEPAAGHQARFECPAATGGRPPAATLISCSSPCPSTHSGSGPSSARPVKNLAAMQPP